MIINDLQKANIEALKARDQVARAIYSVIISKYDVNSPDDASLKS